MILSILIILILIIAIIHGFHRGFVQELVNLFGIVLAFVVSIMFADPTATFLRTICNFLVTNKSYVNTDFWKGIGFLLVFAVLLTILHYVERILNKIVSLPVIKQFNSLLGAVVGFIISLILITMVLSILIMLHIEWFTSLYNDSTIAQFLVGIFPQILFH